MRVSAHIGEAEAIRTVLLSLGWRAEMVDRVVPGAPA